MLTITLPEETEARLKKIASKRGELGPAEYALLFIENELTRIETDPTLALFEQWEREQATDDPDEIARREKEWEEFKEEMNRSRLEMEGPNSRKPFP